MFSREYIMTPGPTPIPERIIKAIISKEALLPAYSKIYGEDLELVKKLVDADGKAIIIGGGATVGLEATLASLIDFKDKVLVLSAGFFGDALYKMVKYYSNNVYVLRAEAGKTVSVSEIKKFLNEHPDTKFVALTHCETTTGALFNLEEISEVVREISDAKIIVDCVSTVGAVPISLRKGHADAVVFGVQKVLNMPPGLAVIVLGNNALEVLETRQCEGYYLNLKMWLNFWEERGYLPSTPPVNLLHGLKEAINIIFEEGLENVFKRHKKVSEIIRAYLKELGLRLVIENDDIASPTITAFYLPKGVSDKLFIEHLWSKFKVLLAKTYGDLEGKAIRIGHMGSSATMDYVYITLIAITLTLKNLNLVPSLRHIPVEYFTF